MVKPGVETVGQQIRQQVYGVESYQQHIQLCALSFLFLPRLPKRSRQNVAVEFPFHVQQKVVSLVAM